MAQEYEDEHSKEKILEEYLNTATYGTTDGRSAVGVGAASEVFFDKSVKELGPEGGRRCSPGCRRRPPTTTRSSTSRRRSTAATRSSNAMAGQGYITQEKADEIKVQGPRHSQRGNRFEEREQQFFFDYVQDELIARYGIRKVRQGGLRVYTTLDPALQAAAETAIAAHPTDTRRQRARLDRRRHRQDPRDGVLLDYDTSQFNLAADGTRQPGSSFKPFVLTTAVDQGIDPDSTYYPAPGSITLNPTPTRAGRSAAAAAAR